MMTNKLYPQSINTKLNALEREKKATLELMQVAMFAEKLQKDFPDLVQGVSIETYFGRRVSIRVFPKVLSDLAKILRHVRKFGYQMQKDGISDYPDSAMRIYRLTNHMEITAHFNTSSSVDEKKENDKDQNENSEGKHCRYVKVGEKQEVVIKPIYELQCN